MRACSRTRCSSGRATPPTWLAAAVTGTCFLSQPGNSYPFTILRWSLVALGALAAVLVPTVALAKPKLAVAPLDGDKDGAISDVVAEEAAEHGKTTKPDRVQKEIDKLDISSMSAKSVKKLRMKLEVDVVIHGKVGKDGGKKHLELVLDGSGKAKSGLEVDFRTTKDLKKALAKKLGR